VAASRPASLSLIPAALALLASAGIAAATTAGAEARGEPSWVVNSAGSASVAGVLLILAAVTLTRAAVVGWAAALLAVGYAILLAGSGRAIDPWAPLFGLGILLSAELAFTARELRRPHASTFGLELSRWLRLLAVAGAGGVIGAAATVVASTVPGSVPGLLAGSAGAVCLVALAAWMRGRGAHRPGATPPD